MLRLSTLRFGVLIPALDFANALLEYAESVEGVKFMGYLVCGYWS